MITLVRKYYPPDLLVSVLVGIFLIAFAINGLMLWLAFDYEPQFAFSGSYCGLPGKAEGWQVAITPSLRKPDNILLKVADGKGTPMQGVKASITARHASLEHLEQKLIWQEDPIFPGNYRARFPLPAAGKWAVFFDLEQNFESFSRVLLMDLP